MLNYKVQSSTKADTELQFLNENKKYRVFRFLSKVYSVSILFRDDYFCVRNEENKYYIVSTKNFHQIELFVIYQFAYKLALLG